MKELTSNITTPTFAQSCHNPLLRINYKPQSIPTTSFLQTSKNLQSQLVRKSILNNVHAKFLTRKIHKEARTVKVLTRLPTQTQRNTLNPPQQSNTAERPTTNSLSEWFQSQVPMGQSSSTDFKQIQSNSQQQWQNSLNQENQRILNLNTSFEKKVKSVEVNKESLLLPDQDIDNEVSFCPTTRGTNSVEGQCSKLTAQTDQSLFSFDGVSDNSSSYDLSQTNSPKARTSKSVNNTSEKTVEVKKMQWLTQNVYVVRASDPDAGPVLQKQIISQICDGKLIQQVTKAFKQ